VKEGVAHLNLPLPGTPVLDLWGNHQAPVVQHHPFLSLGGTSIGVWVRQAARIYPVIGAGVAERYTRRA
jgi:hypothetical protein